MKILFGIPSYRRPYVETLDYIDDCLVFIDGSDEEDYLEKGNAGKERLVVCPDGVQGNLCRVRNYMIDWAFERDYDAIAILDDDISTFMRWCCDDVKKVQYREEIKSEDVRTIFEKYTLICKELGFYFWGFNCNSDSLSYRQYLPFGMVAYIGGPVQVHLRGSECRYDERLYLKEDYDMSLQQCNRYRGDLRVNMLYYVCKQAKQTGGCALSRSSDSEREQFELLKQKWGGDIVRDGNSHFTGNIGTRRRKVDFNPVIRIPIKGA